MRKIIIQIALDIIYLFTNYFICYIPCWHIRKVLYRLCGMKIGKDARIHMCVKVLIPWKITIGKRSVVNEFCFLDGRGNITIGDDVSISIYSIIITGTHKKDSETFEYAKNQVVLEDNVWLGARAMVLDGSLLQKGTIVGAGSVFKGISDKNGIYIGIPARKMATRNLDASYKIHFNPFFR